MSEELRMTPQENFRKKAPAIMRRLMADFDLTDIQAAAILGNLGQESAGLTAFQEVNPTIKGSRGGWGWAQWTGPRRVAFEKYCKRLGLDPKADTANYAYLWRELSGHQPGFDYRKAITELKKADGLSAAVKAFERAYERAGTPAYASRDRWAERALAAFRAEVDDTASAEVKKIQERLVALGHTVVVDGVIGPKTLAAIAAALGVD
jgi:hypothetical protein